MVKSCSWCGREISGQVICPGKGFYSSWGTEKPELLEIELGFCCTGCAWRWGIEEHGLMGMTGNEARQHLIEEHGLTHPPGPPAGEQSQECIKFFTREAQMIMDCIRPDIRSNIFSAGSFN